MRGLMILVESLGFDPQWALTFWLPDCDVATGFWRGWDHHCGQFVV